MFVTCKWLHQLRWNFEWSLFIPDKSDEHEINLNISLMRLLAAKQSTTHLDHKWQ